MTPLLEITVYFTLLTFATVVAGAAIRNREWTSEGLSIGLGNRDNLQEATPLGGRADRRLKTPSRQQFFLCP